MDPHDAALAVAVVLAAIAVLRVDWGLLGAGVLPPVGPAWLGTVGPAAVGVVLLAHAVGDFRYVGFLKRVPGTGFALVDTRLYSPLCLLPGLAALWSVFGRGR